ELKDLLKQAGDAQALSAALDALEKAGMCIANGQCWGQCKGGKGRPNVGQGGTGGPGVGTWGEESGWMQIPENTPVVDSSDLERGDLDPRGHTDRDVERPDNMTPTKIRGQISPGTSMPSITLKGVSIKGVSNVKYEEAAQAAQTEAQSALNQDKVPRA